ncbi:MAG: hypothetical protein LBC27_06755 [Spirochaetaceae bacterium]|nr:hypothetical protein [Spirochaetaceae bacterium]
MGAFSPAADAAGENRAFRYYENAFTFSYRFNRLRGASADALEQFTELFLAASDCSQSLTAMIKAIQFFSTFHYRTADGWVDTRTGIRVV